MLFLSIGIFALGLDAYITTGLLPDIGKSFGTNTVQNAQTITVFTLCYALSAPFFSTILAKWSIRKILILALSIFTLANILSALSISLEMLLFSRAIAGIGAGLFSPMASSAAVALSEEKNKGKALRFIFAGMSSGVVIGVPVGLNIAT